MIDIQRFVCNMFQENCYVVSDDTRECVIIDCGAFFEEEKKAISEYIRANGLTPKRLLCTHGHVDHNFGNKFVFSEYGLRPEASKDDLPLMEKLGSQAMAFVGVDCGNDFPAPDKYIADGDTVTFGRHSFSVISTPGHSPGSVFLYCEDEAVAFSGDTLFRMSVGRTDLELGDYSALISSLQKISLTLPADTTVLPGHGGRTVMAEETAHNPFLKTSE